jgi:hypothetical protein
VQYIRGYYYRFRNQLLMAKMVVPPGIEPGSRASETLILSIVLRDQEKMWRYGKCGNALTSVFSHKELSGELRYFHIPHISTLSHYLISPGAFVAKIFTAMASNITPKNFRMAIKPAGPSNFSKKLSDFNTMNTTRRFISIASSMLWSW